MAGDVREVPVILDGVRAGIDLTVPVCLIMGFLLHFFTADEARDLVASYTAALPPGSLLVLSAIHVETQGADEGFAGYSSAVAPVYNHSAAEFASFFDPFEILPPGVVDARRWGARPGAPDLQQRDQYAIAGAARTSQLVTAGRNHRPFGKIKSIIPNGRLASCRQRRLGPGRG